MKYAVIDIGSNTIRINLYSLNDNKYIKRLSKKNVAGLSSYISNGIIVEKGIVKLERILKSYKEIIDDFRVDKVFCFATAAVRSAKNNKSIIKRMKKSTGITIELVSGKDEAKYSYVGLNTVYKLSDGIIIDIGGGSTEVLVVKENKVVYSKSLPIGSLNLYSNHVKKIFPTNEEIKNIKIEVDSFIKSLPKYKFDTIHSIGGSMRAISNIIEEYSGLKNGRVELEDVKNFMKNIKVKPELIEILLQISPARVHTLTPGIIIAQRIAKYYKANSFSVCELGVREGYLYSRVNDE